MKWCIVPARGGSKRLPGKNKKVLAGKPLVCWTLDACLGSFDKVIFTSDDNELLDTVQQRYLDQHDLLIEQRPKLLCSDTSKVIETVRYYAVKYSDKMRGDDQLWLCLPTCPLRTKEDIEAATRCLHTYSSVVSITDFDFPPRLAFNKSSAVGSNSVKSNWIREEDESRPFANDNTRSQDYAASYRPNGALYGMYVGDFQRYGNFFKTENVYGYYMPRERSVDIDTKFDFDIAEMMLRKRKITKFTF